MPQAMTRLYLIRHGETPWNTEKRIQGHTDIGLNDNGLSQAQATAAWLAAHGPEIKHIYSSDLTRAWLTATTIADAINLTPIPVSQFRERRYGLFEGLTHQEAATKYPYEYHQLEQRNPDFVPSGGESLYALFERVTHRLQMIAREHIGEQLVIVCHGGVLDVINRFVRGNPLHQQRDFEIPNASISWVRFREGATPPWMMENWGSTQHLKSPALDELEA